jgi:putative transposase
MAAAQEKGNVMPGPAPRSITVSAPQREVLERLLRQHSCPQALALRVRIVLRTAGGARVEPLARELHCTADTVQKWRDRWADAEAQLAAAEGEASDLVAVVATALADAPRSGRPPTFSAEQVVHIVNLACTSPRSLGRPVDAWTPRELADEAQRQGLVESISASSVGRFLGRSGVAAPSQPLLAERQDQSD